MQSKLILLMKEKNVSIKELSKLLGISEKQTSFKIKGKVDFKCTEMFVIAKHFNLGVEDIFLPSMYENGTLKHV